MSSRVPLRSLVSSYIGGGWGKDEIDDSHPEPAYVIRGTDLADAEYGSVESVPYRFHKTSNLASRRLEPNEIVMEVSGGSIDQPVGRVMYVDEHVLGSLDGPVMCASFCKRVVPDADAVHPSYLYWYLQAVYASGLIERYQVQSTGIRNLQFEYLLDDLAVHLPSRDKQERAVAVLDAILEALRTSRRRIKILEEMARLIYREWFAHFRFPGHEDVELIDSDLGPVPNGWVTARLEDCCEFQSGKTISKDNRGAGSVPVYGANGVIGRTSLGPNAPACTVMGKIGSCGALHRSAVDCWVTNNAFAVLPGAWTHPLLVWLGLREIDFAPLIGGAANPYLPLKNFGHLLQVVPAEAIVQEFVQAVEPMFDLIDCLSRQNRALSEARDLLLPRMISGELDVSEVDLDLDSVA